jgi:hypothetical protein
LFNNNHDVNQQSVRGMKRRRRDNYTNYGVVKSLITVSDDKDTMKIALFQGRLQKKDVRGRPQNANYVYFFVFRLGDRNKLFLSVLGSTYHPKRRVNWRHNLA